MSKTGRIIIASVLILPLLLLASCKGKPAGAVNSKTKLIIKSSYMNTPLFLAGTVLEGLINYNTNLLSINEPESVSSNDKIKAIMDGSADVAFISGPAGYMAFNGHPSYWDTPQGIRSLFGIFPTVFTGFTHDDKNIKKISDLIGHTIALDKKGSVSGDLLLYFLKLNGINESNTKIFRVEQGEGERLFSDGFVDFIWYSDSYKKYSMTKVPFTENDKLREFLSVYPVFYTEAVSPDGDTESDKIGRVFASSTFLACSEDMDDETAYLIVKTWFENIDYIKNFFPNYNENNAKVYLERRVPVPMHPGAERYFREVGLLN